MIYLRVSCRKHPRYLGYMQPRAGWYPKRKGEARKGGPCPGCNMVYAARHNSSVDLSYPWVKFCIVRKPS